MSAQSVARWNAIPMSRPEADPAESLKRSRTEDAGDNSDGDVSLVSRTPSPEPEGMDIDDLHAYDAYVHKPAREVVTVDTKIKPSNIGFAMLAKMGWQEGQPVGLSGDGRVDPVPFTLKNDQTGLGKITQDVEMIETTVAQRRELDSERWAKESKAQKQLRLEEADKRAALQTSLDETLRAFYCALCDKQFKTVAQYDEHTNSYAHAHKAREKDMKASARIVTLDDADARKEKERKREERELRKLAKAQGIRLAKPAQTAQPEVTITQPVSVANSVPVQADVKQSGWSNIGSAGPSHVSASSAGGWAPATQASAPSLQVQASPPSNSAAPAFRTGGWSSLDNNSLESSHASSSTLSFTQNTSAVAVPGPRLAMKPADSSGWAAVSSNPVPHITQATTTLAEATPLDRPLGPVPDPPSVAVAPSPVPRPHRPPPEPAVKVDREQKRSGWQSFRAGKAGRR